VDISITDRSARPLRMSIKLEEDGLISFRNYAAHTPSFPPTFLLNTVSTFFPPRKYIGILDLPLTSFSFIFRLPIAFLYGSSAGHLSSYDADSWKGYESRGLFISTIGTWRQNVGVFWAHASQRSWDRYLYVLVSRYMWFNDVVKVEKIVS
jgi:N-acetylglucosaminylphosphatidylinositol deacetylase